MLKEGVLRLDTEAAARMPAIDDPRELREAVIATWHGRMVNEWMSSFVFAQLAKGPRMNKWIDESDDAPRGQGARSENTRSI